MPHNRISTVSELISIVWTLRNEALLPVAVAAFGDAARTLLRRCLARDDKDLALLRGIWVELPIEHGPGPHLAKPGVDSYGVIIAGDAELLPWVDGAFYFGQDADAPSLLLPCALEPSVPIPLFEKVLRQRLVTTPPPDLAPPLVLWPGKGLVVSMATARLLDRKRAEEWIAIHEIPCSSNVKTTAAHMTEQVGALHEGTLDE